LTGGTRAAQLSRRVVDPPHGETDRDAARLLEQLE